MKTVPSGRMPRYTLGFNSADSASVPERRLLREQGRGQDFRGKHEGAGSGDAVQELAAADVFDAAHDRPPFAAALMAARIRW